MRILHVCLAAFYIDNYSYQENILPRMHKKMGNEVEIIASTETYIDGKKLGYIKPSSYKNEDGIRVIRIPYVSWIPSKLVHKLRVYSNFYMYIDKFNPDLIFLHDTQFLSLRQVVKYAKKHPNVRILADSHTDYYNSAKSFISRWILHEMIYKPTIRRAVPYIDKFYGTLPIRVDFMEKVYKIPHSKTGFLPMGVDDDIAEKYESEDIRDEIRNRYGIQKKDFLIVSGGKIDHMKKQVLTLMKTINEINNDHIKMFFFGSVVDELKDEFDNLCSDRVKYLGWASVEQSYEYFSIADLVVFPSSHSVYWEQAAGLGKPIVVKYWNGITHIDLGGNAILLKNDSKNELKKIISSIATDKRKYIMMKKAASEKGKEFFSYRRIAEKCLR